MLNEDFVSVLVPKSLVTGVYGWIAAQSGATIKSESASGAAYQEISSGGQKPSRALLSLKRMINESPTAMKEIFGAIARHAPNEVSTKVLAAALTGKAEADSLTVAGTLGAFGRRFKNRHKGEEPPFLARWDHDAGCQMYSMSPEIAAEVLRFLGGG